MSNYLKQYQTMSNNIKQIKKVVALALFVGALPFIFYASAYAKDTGEGQTAKVENKWLDDYSKPVGLTYGAQAVIQPTYMWRGIYSGAANIQASANVGYGGLYADMWWNIGVTDWSFQYFQPEVDITIGFNRWGLNVYLLYIHNFNCGFFDFNNYIGIGNRLEVNAKYTVSSKIPLTIHWGTRVSASDGYRNEAGEVVRAWSSYLELSYIQYLPYGLSLRGALGITPWRSVYTHYSHEFAVQNVSVYLRKDWSVSEHCGLMLKGELAICPWLLAEDNSSAAWRPLSPRSQSVNANLAFGVYLK
jgi:hypothetical protein